MNLEDKKEKIINSIDDSIAELEKKEDNFDIIDKVEIKLHRLFGGIYGFFRYDLIQGLKNFWRFKKVIWRFRWWDYGFSDDLTNEAYKVMAENWHKSHYVGFEKDEKELKIIVELFKRMKETNTFTIDEDEEDKIRKDIYQRIARKRLWN